MCLRARGRGEAFVEPRLSAIVAPAAALPYCDIVFGNETEARKFAEVHGFGTDNVAAIAARIAALPRIGAARPRIVVFTQGSDPTVLVVDGETRTFPVIPIEQVWWTRRGLRARAACAHVRCVRARCRRRLWTPMARGTPLWVGFWRS